MLTDFLLTALYIVTIIILFKLANAGCKMIDRLYKSNRPSIIQGDKKDAMDLYDHVHNRPLNGL